MQIVKRVYPVAAYQIGERIKSWRRQQCLTQEELAFKIRMKPQYLSKLECGYHYPTPSTAAKLCRQFKITLDEFYA